MNFTNTKAASREGAIASYLTLGGARVDIVETGPRDSGSLYVTVAACQGCPDSRREQWEDGTYGYNDKFVPIERENAIARAESKARAWAQAHAEKCRAMSKPVDR